MLLAKNKRGSILILVLWALSFLTVFTVHIGVRVRQKISVLERLERRSELGVVALSGVHKALQIIGKDIEGSGNQFTPRNKNFWFNNQKYFSPQAIGEGVSEVSYSHYDLSANVPLLMYGVLDEERKINLNNTTLEVLGRLVETVLGYDEEQAKRLAASMIDWREYGETQIEGFLSSHDYSNLEHPYEEKKAPFERIEELLLIKGINEDIYKQLFNFLTVYGDGPVNLNTTSKPVLTALGLSEGLMNKILIARRGPDGLEATQDDYTFNEATSFGNVAVDFGLTHEERNEFNSLIGEYRLGTMSQFYRIESKAVLYEESKVIVCIFKGSDGSIMYWRESY